MPRVWVRPIERGVRSEVFGSIAEDVSFEGRDVAVEVIEATLDDSQSGLHAIEPGLHDIEPPLNTVEPEVHRVEAGVHLATQAGHLAAQAVHLSVHFAAEAVDRCEGSDGAPVSGREFRDPVGSGGCRVLVVSARHPGRERISRWTSRPC